MAKPTPAESIRNLELTAASHEEQIAFCLKALEQGPKESETVRNALADLRRDVAVLQTEAANLRKTVEELDRRRWTIAVALISAFVGGALTLLAQITARFVMK